MVLMLVKPKALERTLNTGRAWFWSRSRGVVEKVLLPATITGT